MQVSSVTKSSAVPSFSGKVIITNFKTRTGSSCNISGADDRKLFDCFTKLKKQADLSASLPSEERFANAKLGLVAYIDKLQEITKDKIIKELILPVKQTGDSSLLSSPTFSLFNMGGRYTTIKTKDFEIAHDLTF